MSASGPPDGSSDSSDSEHESPRGPDLRVVIIEYKDQFDYRSAVTAGTMEDMLPGCWGKGDKAEAALQKRANSYFKRLSTDQLKHLIPEEARPMDGGRGGRSRFLGLARVWQLRCSASDKPVSAYLCRKSSLGLSKADP